MQLEPLAFGLLRLGQLNFAQGLTLAPPEVLHAAQTAAEGQAVRGQQSVVLLGVRWCGQRAWISFDRGVIEWHGGWTGANVVRWRAGPVVVPILADAENAKRRGGLRSGLRITCMAREVWSSTTSAS